MPLLPSFSLTTWLRIGALAAVAIAVYLIYSRVDAHFDHVKELETQNKSLVERNTELGREVERVQEINKENQEIYRTKLQQVEDARRLAEGERQAAEQRATRYRSIRDEAKDTPTEDRHPVSPAVRGAVDRLWPPGGS